MFRVQKFIVLYWITRLGNRTVGIAAVISGQWVYCRFIYKKKSIEVP